jgi:hypothetical protein
MERKEEATFQETKSFDFEIKKLTAEGEFEGYAAVFNLVDHGGDIIEPGAFRKTIRENRGVFPMTWYHNVRDPIGGVKVKEDEHGLFVKGKLNLEVQSAREKYHLMKQEEPGPVIKGLSFGYDTIKQELDDTGKKPVRRLKELKLYEVAPVLFAMQPHAQITDVKTGGVRANLESIEGILNEIILWKHNYKKALTPEQTGMAIKAIERLEALLDPTEPPKGTPAEEKPPFSSVIEELKGLGKPADGHFFGSTIDTLKNKNKENNID